MNCYLCKRKIQSQKHLYKNGFQLCRCPVCGLIWYDFRADYTEFLQQQYSAGYFTGAEELNAYYDYGKDKRNIVKNITAYLKQIRQFEQDGKLLDVGCAYGYFLEAAEESGFEVFGIDPSSHAIEQAKSNFSRKVQQATLEGARFGKKQFAVVTMFDVFEHLKDPRADLRSVRQLLRTGGLLTIATGDTGSLWARISGRRWTFYNPPQHIFYFNRQNLSRLLRQEGFEVKRIVKTGKWLSLRYILHLASTTGESGIARKIYRRIKNSPVGKVPLYIRLNDNMLVIAQTTEK